MSSPPELLKANVLEIFEERKSLFIQCFAWIAQSSKSSLSSATAIEVGRIPLTPRTKRMLKKGLEVALLQASGNRSGFYDRISADITYRHTKTNPQGGALQLSHQRLASP
ncbi:unnamed protein product [Ceratitis capitata]|uniref:(Mediterranean fruit fly) hypothetical protein n=1 Tax=Ceratitis capitata TaxID=7213 RepID=A0A811UED0_CERCA|nr:unnamed protein product [Ceratitis capitata]